MKVLIVVSGLSVGGQERQLRLLVYGLVERGHQVDVVVPYKGGEYEQELEDNGVTVIHLFDTEGRSWNPLIRAWRAVLRGYRLRNVIHGRNPDIVHGYEIAANIYASLSSLFLKPKIVWGIHNALRIDSVVLRVMERLAFTRADSVVAVSRDAKAACVSRGLPGTRIVVIDNGVDVVSFRIEPSWREEVRGHLGIGENQPLIGAVGRIVESKSPEMLLSAWSMVSERMPKARFVVVGPGNPAYVAELKDLAVKYHIAERVAWVGARDDVEKYLNAVDLYVSASAHEGLASVWLEAMACGTPCVVTDVGDAHRVIGDSGYVVPAGEPNALAEAVIQAIANLERWRPERIRESAVERFSSDRMVEQTERLYAHVLDGFGRVEEVKTVE